MAVRGDGFARRVVRISPEVLFMRAEDFMSCWLVILSSHDNAALEKLKLAAKLLMLFLTAYGPNQLRGRRHTIQ